MKLEPGKINIHNESAEEVVIDIEGIIGYSEWWQFDDQEGKISTWDKFKHAIDAIKGISAAKVTVNIRSLGGNTNDALLIHDALKMLKANVTTVCFGYTASAATVIAQAATKGNRKISSNCLYLIHQCWTYAMGNIAAFEESIGMMKKTNELISELYASTCESDAEKFTELMGRNNGNGEWLTAKEALENGLVDTILQVSDTAALDTSSMQMFHYPEIPKDKALAPVPLTFNIRVIEYSKGRRVLSVS
ncbi:ATP-dependent Clp protease proteolytic subunit, partial [termite gut metagenome]